MPATDAKEVCWFKIDELPIDTSEIVPKILAKLNL